MVIIFAVISVCIVYLIYNFIYSKLWNKNLLVELYFEKDTCVCGESSFLYEVVSNLKVLPISILRVRFYVSKYLDFGDGQNVSVSDKSYKNDIFSVMFYQRIKRKTAFTCRRRGFYQIDKIDIVSYNLFLKTPLVAEMPCNLTLSVLPKFASSKKLDTVFKSIYGQMAVERAQLTDPFEFKGIRQYETFDSVRDINWNASAKSEELMVNVSGYTSNREVVIILNVTGDNNYVEDRVIEQCISISAGICAKFIKAQIPAAFITNGTDCVTGNEISLKGASGEGHIKAIRKGLSRLDWKNAVNAERMLSNIVKEPNKTYIFVSCARKKSLTDCFAHLSSDNGKATFINVYKKGDDCGLNNINSINVINWEIDRFDNI